MSSLTPIYIAGMDQGLTADKKPFLFPENAYQSLENAYVWRDRLKKRQGNQLLGRLRRVLDTVSIGNIEAPAAGTFDFNIFTGLGVLATEPNAQIQPLNITIVIAAPISQTLTDTLGTGVLTIAPAGVITAARLNYSTGVLSLTFSAAVAASAATFSGGYFPSLPVMGISNREIAAINAEQYVYFDTKYAYIFSGSGFQEFVPGTTWSGTDSDFFWTTNFRGILPNDRIFFVTNFVNDAADPMRYLDAAGAWQTFAPAIAGTVPPGTGTADKFFMFQAKLLIPYYGRLLAFNTWEGETIASSVNIFNRCRFSQVGNPLQQTVMGPPFVGGAWRSDVFGKGGFIDAPTNEAITSVKFFKNTLLVGFERSRWQLRYVGEYGLPFLWERISADFGTESTFSEIVFDDFVLSVGDRAIVASTDVTTRRIDEQIPDLVFSFSNSQGGLERVNGIRDYQRELVFWCYNDWESQNKFPNTVLVYNYRNNTFAKFRDNVTFFGTFQSTVQITWDNLNVFWDDMNQTWDDVDEQALFPRIVAGNQQGYVHYYGYTTQDQPSLSITNIDYTVSPNVITVINHNMKPFDIIYITNALYSTAPAIEADLNNRIFQAKPVYVAGVLQTDKIGLAFWTGTNYGDTPASAAAVYIGGGEVTLFPLLYVQTKDFNPYKEQGLNMKLSYIDFLTDATPSAVMSIILYLNTSPAAIGNLLVGNKDVETYLPIENNLYVPGSDYAWHRFFATLSGQFISLAMTYNDDLMNDLTTHQQDWVLNAIALNVRPGGRQVL